MRVEKLRGSHLLLILCLFLGACSDSADTVPPEPAKDTTPPRILFVTPGDDELDVEVDKVIRIEFDELVNEDDFINGDVEFFSGKDEEEQRPFLSARPFDLDFSTKTGVGTDPVTGAEIDTEASVVEIAPPTARFALDTSYTFKIFIPTAEEFNKTPEEREQDEKDNEQTVPGSDDQAGDSDVPTDVRGDKYNEISNYFTVESGEWRTAASVNLAVASVDPEADSVPLTGDVHDAVTASNAAGEVVVVTRQNVNDVAQVFISKYLPNSNQWTTVGSAVPSEVNATQLSTIASTSVFGAKVAVAKNGRIAVGWYQAIAPGQIDSVWVRVFDGTQWTAPMRFGSAVADSGSPDLLFDSDGNLFVVWRQMMEGYYRAFAGTFAAQAQPSAEPVIGIQISGAEDGHAYLPLLSTADSSRVRAFWTHAVHNGSRRLFSRMYSSGSWLPGQRIDVSNTGSVGHYSVVTGPKNEVMVAWDQFDGQRSNVLSRRILGSSLGPAPELRETDSTVDALSPSMAIDRDGKIILLWRQTAGGIQQSLRETIYEKDTGWTVASELASTSDSHVDPVVVSFDREGHATAIWRQVQGATSSVLTRRYLRFTGWTEVRIITEESDPVLGSPVSAQMYEDGRVLAVWAQNDGSKYRLTMNRYVEKSILPPENE